MKVWQVGLAIVAGVFLVPVIIRWYFELIVVVHGIFGG